MTEFMNAVLLTGCGGVEQLEYTQLKRPAPRQGEALIKVSACSINNTDISTRTGWYTADGNFQEILQDRQTGHCQKPANWSQNNVGLPRIQGADIVGRVVATGADVPVRLLDKRVIVDPWIRGESLEQYQYVGSELDGGFAEYAVIPATNIYPITSSLSDIELATVPCACSTAENLLTRAEVTAGDRVLVMGASGGVGSSAVQLAKIRGATVIAIVGADKEQPARKTGADYVYLRNGDLASNLANHRITVCVDVVGGEYFDIIFKALSVGGRFVTSGAIAGPVVTLDLRTVIYKDIEIRGANRFEPKVFQNLVGYIEQGLLKPQVAKVFSLAEIREAQKFFQSKNFFGKVVVIP